MHESFFEMIFGTKNLNTTESSLRLTTYKGRFWLSILFVIVLVLGLFGDAITEYNSDVVISGQSEKQVTYGSLSQIDSSQFELSELHLILIQSFQEVFGEYIWVVQLIIVLLLLPFVIRFILRFVEITGIEVEAGRIKIKRGFSSFEQSTYFNHSGSEISEINLKFKGKHTRLRLYVQVKLHGGEEKTFKLPARVFGQQSLKNTAEWIQNHRI